MQRHNDQNHGDSDNEAVLNEVVRNTEMGKNTTEQLIHITEDRQLKASLLNQQRQFRQLNQRAHTALAALGTHGHGQGRMAKMAAHMGIASKTMTDKSSRNLADMLIQGATQGYTDCEMARRDHPRRLRRRDAAAGRTADPGAGHRPGNEELSVTRGGSRPFGKAPG